MDSDPPKNPPPPRKLKFAPRAPPRRKPKIEVKKEEVEDVDDARVKDLLRRVNEGQSRRHKVEKKVLATQIAFGYGGEASSLKSYRFPRGGSNANSGQNLAINGEGEKEYKEPWDYNSYYPVTLPLRKPYSGNPETRDGEEFGKDGQSKIYDENSSNSAIELGLLEENPDTNMFLIQLPSDFPIFKKSDAAEGQEVKENSKRPGGSKGAEKACKLNELPSGLMGKMLVYKSGKVKLKLGDTLYDVSSGLNCKFAQDVVAINTAEKHCCAVGEVGKHATVAPDVDALLDSLADL